MALDAVVGRSVSVDPRSLTHDLSERLPRDVARFGASDSGAPTSICFIHTKMAANASGVRRKVDPVAG